LRCRCGFRRLLGDGLLSDWLLSDRLLGNGLLSDWLGGVGRCAGGRRCCGGVWCGGWRDGSIDGRIDGGRGCRRI